MRLPCLLSSLNCRGRTPEVRSIGTCATLKRSVLPTDARSSHYNIAEITEAGANEHIDKMSKKYTGQDKYGFHQPGDVRVICKIMPDQVIAQ
jgi:hypothetical protein